MNTSGAALLALRAWRSSTASSTGNTWTIRTYAATTKQTKAAKPTSGTAGSSGGSSAGAGVNVAGKKLDPPSLVFKQVDKAALGPPGTSKDGQYKNPEYFSYHNMSYTDMEIVMKDFRVPQPSNSSKK